MFKQLIKTIVYLKEYKRTSKMLFFHFTTLRLLSPLYFPFYTYLLSLSNITFQLCLDALEKQDVAEDMTVSAEVEEMNVTEVEVEVMTVSAEVKEMNVTEVEVEVMTVSAEVEEMNVTEVEVEVMIVTEIDDIAEDVAEVEEINVSEAEELNVSAEVEVKVMIISVDENVIDEIAENAVEVK